MRQQSPTSLLLPVYVPTLILGFCRGILLPILPLYARSFDISYGLVGLVLAGEGIGTLAADVPAGVLVRKVGRKPVMVLGVSGMAASVLGLYWARTVLAVLALRLLTGAATALWNISRHAYIAEATTVYQRGRALSIFGGINRIGTMAGPAVGGLLASLYGYHAAFVVYGLLGFAPVFVLAAAVASTSRAGDATALRGRNRGSLLAVLRSHRREFATAGVGQLLAQMLRQSRPIIIPLYAADVVGLDELGVGTIISLAGFLDTLMFYPAGLIMDRFGRKHAIVPCFLGQALGMALVPFATTFYGLLGATALIGLSNGIGSGTMMTLGADLAPREAVGEFLGLWRLIGDAGHTGSPLVVGSLADLLDLSAAAWGLSGVGFLAAGTFAFLVAETLRGPPERR